MGERRDEEGGLRRSAESIPVQTDEREGSFPAARLLHYDDPGEVLARISAGDPLQLTRRAALLVRERAFFLDTDALAYRAMLRIAVAAPTYRGEPELETWLEERLVLALEDLLRYDVELRKNAGAALSEEDDRTRFLVQTLAVSPDRALHVCASFNALDERARKRFFALLLEKKSVKECLAAGLGPEEELKKDVLKGLSIVLGNEEEAPRGDQP